MIELRKLKHLATISPSNVDKRKVEGERPVLLCNYTDVYYHPVIREGMDLMEATASPEQIARFSLRGGDVLITKDSETADDIAIPSFVERDLPGVLCGYHLSVVRPRQDAVDPKFLYWCLASDFVRSQAENLAVGITRVGIRSDLVGTLRIPMPRLDMQRKIAVHLDVETSRIITLLAVRQNTGRLLEERWQSLMHAGVSGHLTESGARRAATLPWLVSVPAHWREVKLTLFARLGSGHTPSRSHQEWWEDPSIPWITTGEIGQVRNDRVEFLNETREMISEEGLANSAAVLHPRGTVVLCRTASAGYSAIMGADMATSQDFATWTCGPDLRPRFLLLCLRVMRQDLLGRLAMGSTHQTIYMPDIEGIRIPLPPLDEQDAVIEAVYSRLPSLDKAIQRIARQVQLLEKRRNALVTAAVTGELEIPKAAA